MEQDLSWIPDERKGQFVLRRGRQDPVSPQEALKLTSDKLAEQTAKNSSDPLVLAGWALTRGAWAEDMNPAFYDGVGKLFAAPDRVSAKERDAWQDELSALVVDTLRGRTPGQIAEGELVTAQEVRFGLIQYLECTLEEIGPSSEALDEDESLSAEQWRDRFAEVISWE